MIMAIWVQYYYYSGSPNTLMGCCMYCTYLHGSTSVAPVSFLFFFSSFSFLFFSFLFFSSGYDISLPHSCRSLFEYFLIPIWYSDKIREERWSEYLDDCSIRHLVTIQLTELGGLLTWLAEEKGDWDWDWDWDWGVAWTCYLRTTKRRVAMSIYM